MIIREIIKVQLSMRNISALTSSLNCPCHSRFVSWIKMFMACIFCRNNWFRRWHLNSLTKLFLKMKNRDADRMITATRSGNWVALKNVLCVSWLPELERKLSLLLETVQNDLRLRIENRWKRPNSSYGNILVLIRFPSSDLASSAFFRWFQFSRAHWRTNREFYEKSASNANFTPSISGARCCSF